MEVEGGLSGGVITCGCGVKMEMRRIESRGLSQSHENRVFFNPFEIGGLRVIQGSPAF